jgi:hypothetical protein
VLTFNDNDFSLPDLGVSSFNFGFFAGYPPALERVVGVESESIDRSIAVEGEVLRLRFRLVADLVSFAEEPWDCDCFCFENIAWIPSFLRETGSIKVDDSVPTLPTSFGT